MAVSFLQPEQTAAASDRTLHNFIGGQWVRSSGTESLAIHDPASRELLAEVPLSSAQDVDRAVSAARAAFSAWRATPAIERARVLFRLKVLIEQNKDVLARSVTREHGKLFSEARAEIQRGIENIEHACGIPTLLMGETLEDIAPGVDCETIRQPLGVFAAITPYNFPIMIPLWFWPYAVATGNTFILKPSEQDPITHQRICELASEAGLPAGVLNVVHGGSDVVTALCDHPGITGVSFVGSSQVAKLVYARAAASGKRAQALGGAKNHMIVLPDAEIEPTVDALVSSLFGSTGQRCLAGSVVVGVGEVYRDVRERFVERAAALRLGHGLEDGTDMGPLVSAPHRERVLGYVDQGEREGARMVLDGRNRDVPKYPHGYFVGATVFENVQPTMKLGQEEVFGPVAALTHVKTLEDAVSLMHQVEYGNATSIFTTSGKSAREFRYRAGISMMGVNIGVAAPMAFFPFGGSRASFYGDLKACGRDAISFYTDQRVVISRW